MHTRWDADYRSPESERLSDEAFDYIVRRLPPTLDAVFLDAGCGTGVDSIRLGRRGFRVQGVDFSEAVLGLARMNVKEAGLSDGVALRREDLTALSFPDATFGNVLCWGVLMHIPDVGRALSELARVLRPGGSLVLSEINLHSLQSRAYWAMARLLGRRRGQFTRTEAGIESWFTTPKGTLMVRHTDMQWLERAALDRGLTVKERIAWEFTELYLKTSSPTLRKLIHGFNGFWFRRVRSPGPAFNNLLILEKSLGG